MSLKKRLMYLLAAFATFVFVAASMTIYGTLIHVSDAISDFTRLNDQTDRVEKLRVAARERVLKLRDVVDGREPISPEFLDARNEFFDELEQLAKFAPRRSTDAVWAELLDVSEALKHDTAECIALVESSQSNEARKLLDTRIERVLLDSLIHRLNTASGVLAERSNRSVGELVNTNTNLLILAVVVLLMAALLLIVGSSLIRRWLIVPITKLREATERFSQGDLAFRVALSGEDEMGTLAGAMNTMAVSLTTAQAELHSSEAKYRALFKNLRDAVVICDINGKVVECHEGDTNILGVQGHEYVGRRFLDNWPQWQTKRFDWRTVMDKVVGTGQRFIAPDVPLKLNGANRGEATVDMLVYPVWYNDAQFVAIVLRDVTERSRLQRRVRHADKMEATGTLAGGIAHDFNNLLTSAIGTLSLLGNEIEDAHASDLAQTALRACWQAAGLSRRLLDFASGGHRKPQVLRMKEVVELVLNSLDEPLFAGIKVITECDNDVLVKVDKDQLTQIILNLVRNACDAMPDGGELRVSVSTTIAAHPEVNEPPTTYVVLTVSDTGGGMTPEVKERLFEPFFTTKTRASHRGRGLGLAIVYASVKSAGGFIQVDSEINVGTTFRIHLPVGQGTPEPIHPPVYVAPAEKGEGTILVVDDEPMILDMCADALRQWGYSVISANSISDAAQKFDAAEGGVDLALIDINLPDGSGVLLAEDLVTLDPELRIVFATGFADAGIPHELDGNVFGRLAKPFALDELASTLSAALASPSR